jgi:Lipocalin-like domain
MLTEEIMKQLTAPAIIAALLLSLGAVLLASDAIAQSPKEQIVGAWMLVSADSVRSDGTRVAVFGSNPKGIMIFSRDGHFALVQMRAELPKIAAKSRDQGTPEENQGIVEGSIAYFGTYSVNEAEKTMALKLAGSTFANILGAGEQKRIITSLTPEELKFTNPRTPAGATLEVSWKRAR